MSDVIRIRTDTGSGQRQTAEEILPLVYDELRKIAALQLAQEKPGHTLQATALVHEAFLRLVGEGDAPRWDSYGHFFAAAAEAMRRILVDHARSKGRLKRGGQMQRLPLEDVAATVDASDPDELLALDEGLKKLTAADPQAAEVVKLRYFAGLTMDQTAQALGIAPRTGYYAWEYARSWLKKEMRETSKDEAPTTNE